MRSFFIQNPYYDFFRYDFFRNRCKDTNLFSYLQIFFFTFYPYEGLSELSSENYFCLSLICDKKLQSEKKSMGSEP
jgi:hypothetical protein